MPLAGWTGREGEDGVEKASKMMGTRHVGCVSLRRIRPFHLHAPFARRLRLPRRIHSPTIRALPSHPQAGRRE